jgi:tRNA pseudouridine13 synthase
VTLPAGQPEWPYFLGNPESTGLIRAKPEDFRVQEIPLIEPSGDGSHLWLEIEKRGANTRWVADQLVAASGVAQRDLGYAGMKDRHAVTSQWFSIATQDAENLDWETWTIPDVTVLRAVHHGRKLKTGTLKGNRFHIVVRNLEGNPADLERRLEIVKTKGVPNYFGPQRFGINGNNIQRGIKWLEQGGRLPRHKRSIYLSSVRSFLFNRILGQRVLDQSWDQIQDGEIAMLDGTHSVFECSLPDPLLIKRCAEFDIHPTGLLAGTAGKRPKGPAAKLESEALEAYSSLIASLGRAGAKAGRRALRLVPGELEWEWGDDSLAIQFVLGSGSYATSLLRELVSYSERIHISAT